MQDNNTDTLYQTYDKNLSKITSESQNDAIMNMINADQSANNSTMVNIPADLIGSGQSSGVQNMAKGGIYSSKQRWSDTAAGFFFGIDVDGIAKINIGNATNYLQWDGTNFSVLGALSVASLNIPDTTTTNSFHVDTSGNAWWGSTVLSTAAAKVLNTGVATFQNVTITGGTLAGMTIGSSSLTTSSTTITGAIIQTAASGNRVVMSGLSNDIKFYYSGTFSGGILPVTVYGGGPGIELSTGNGLSTLYLSEYSGTGYFQFVNNTGAQLNVGSNFVQMSTNGAAATVGVNGSSVNINGITIVTGKFQLPVGTNLY